LLSSATPATAPTASHTGPPSRSARTSSQLSAVQASRSNVVVESRWPVASRTAAPAVDAAASSWPARSLPNSRAISPASTTTSAAPSADGSRRPTSDPGATVSMTRASKGVSGGWST
jgi:hypothetical protein